MQEESPPSKLLSGTVDFLEYWLAPGGCRNDGFVLRAVEQTINPLMKVAHLRGAEPLIDTKDDFRPPGITRLSSVNPIPVCPTAEEKITART